MKRNLLIGAMLLIFSISQAQINVGATIGPQIPMGSFGDSFNVGFGFNAAGKYMLQENMAVGLNLGYSRFGTDSDGFSGSMVPITGLFEYHFTSGKFKPYIGADLGLYRYGVKYEISGSTSKDSEIYFGFAPTGGVLYGLNENLSLCANLKLNYVIAEGDGVTWLGLNFGAFFKIK